MQATADHGADNPAAQHTRAVMGPRERCLEAALAVLKDHGPDSLSLREVARRAGVSATAPYRHFETKEVMLAALAEQGMRRFEAALREACPEGLHMMTVERFHQMGRCYVRFASENPEYYRLMFTGVIPQHEAHPDLFAAGESAFNVLLNSIELLQRLGEIRSGEPRLLAAHVWSICHGFASLCLERRVRLIENPEPWDVQFARHFEWAMSGLAATDQPQSDPAPS